MIQKALLTCWIQQQWNMWFCKFQNSSHELFLQNFFSEVFSEISPDAIKDRNLELLGEWKASFAGRLRDLGVRLDLHGLGPYVQHPFSATCRHEANISCTRKNSSMATKRDSTTLILLLHEGFYINVQSDKCIASSGIFVDSLEIEFRPCRWIILVGRWKRATRKWNGGWQLKTFIIHQ